MCISEGSTKAVMTKTQPRNSSQCVVHKYTSTQELAEVGKKQSWLCGATSPSPFWEKSLKKTHKGGRDLLNKKGFLEFPECIQAKSYKVSTFLERKEFPSKQVFFFFYKESWKKLGSICKAPDKHSGTFLESKTRNGLKAMLTWKNKGEISSKQCGNFWEET